MRSALIVILVLVSFLVVKSQDTQRGFQVQIENLSAGSVLPTAFSPAVWAVFSGQNPLFTPGSLASNGLKKFAEDADPSQLFSQAQNATGLSLLSSFALEQRRYFYVFPSWYRF
eukprot:TRINITY_DN4199_c0_g1_i1.p1 TRINITY_DN4199_c0_g1~~TRINITY_DN4199_c0_g1_i1.p1  ORF type:complete len:129 (+),score=40.39 TRINITY_DN4199_c0_g1_i1:46-387(+)